MHIVRIQIVEFLDASHSSARVPVVEGIAVVDITLLDGDASGGLVVWAGRIANRRLLSRRTPTVRAVVGFVGSGFSVTCRDLPGTVPGDLGALTAIVGAEFCSGDVVGCSPVVSFSHTVDCRSLPDARRPTARGESSAIAYCGVHA